MTRNDAVKAARTAWRDSKHAAPEAMVDLLIALNVIKIEAPRNPIRERFGDAIYDIPWNHRRVQSLWEALEQAGLMVVERRE